MAVPSFRCPNCKQDFEPANVPGNLSALCPHCNRVMRWFYAQNNQRYGPLLFAQLSQLAQSGAIKPTDWVFQEGSPQWLAAREVEGLLTPTAAKAIPFIALDAPTLTGTDAAPAMLKAEAATKDRASRKAEAERRSRQLRLKIAVALAGFGVAAAAGVLITVLILTSGDSGTPSNPTDNAKGEKVVQALNPPPGPRVKMAGNEVYNKTLPSTVWIQTRRGMGSGSLVDVQQRLVITNAHVVPFMPDNTGKDDVVTVCFPVFKDGKVVAERDHYQRFPEGVRAGKVILRDEKRDLAIVQLDSLPANAVALYLAKDSATPGETVHAIGNPGASGALWVHTSGDVRQVYHKNWNSGPQDNPNQYSLSAMVVETQVPANPGDSGGPLVNTYGELVGVTQGYSAGATLLSYAIDVSEVRNILSSVKTNVAASGPAQK